MDMSIEGASVTNRLWSMPELIEAATFDEEIA
jgi:hypothetical protein